VRQVYTVVLSSEQYVSFIVSYALRRCYNKLVRNVTVLIRRFLLS